jgi:2,3-bisphosphoglycerate-independent phosphoglycerate mutase
MLKLEKLKNFSGIEGPLLVVVMDGIGLGAENAANAVYSAATPTLDRLFKSYPFIKLKAHGEAVGLPSDDDMGNSEVGHNALGSGQVFSQGAKLVTKSIESGKLFASDTWNKLINNVNENKSALHFIGLLSDGNVHSHIDHLKAMIVNAKKDGCKLVRIHILLDGRDVGETSALDYVRPFEEFIASLRDSDFDVRIASGGGRMNITMDRYEADWKMVELGWKTHVLGEGRYFDSAEQAIKTYRSEASAGAPVIDQNLPPFVIAENGKPLGTINDGDSVIFCNFRGDRAIEISKAFETPADSFDYFDRVRYPKVIYAGMLEYDGDLHIPSNYLVNPPEISNTMSEYLSSAGIPEAAVSETQKYGHVTYFWNGNKSGKFDDKLESYYEIPSDIVPFEQRPWMKCAEIADKVIELLNSGEHKFIRCNFPNGDMVGHTGNLSATKISVEALDLQLARILAAVDKVKGVALITADHGNADEMCELDKKTKLPTAKAKTSHTLNPVPFIIYDNNYSDMYDVTDGGGSYGLANVAATVVNFLGFKSPEVWNKSIISIK